MTWQIDLVGPPQFPLQFHFISFASAGGFLAHQDRAFITFIYELHENGTIWEKASLDRFANKFRMVSNGILKTEIWVI